MTRFDRTGRASRPAHGRTWRAFDGRCTRAIDQQLRHGDAPACPCCGELLEARGQSRISRYLPLDARGIDLECRICRRFRSMVRHTARSLRLVRMRRLAAAVRASGAADPAPALAA